MANPHRTYQPRDTEHSVLHAVIREHLEPFLREVSDRGDGSGLPRFVEQEFREFLTCGVLAHGFTRLRYADCTFERLVPFSCKRRAFCPSCGGRRMAERAASLVDEVLPRVPVRQWVLTLPYRLRYLLAWDHALCRAVLGVSARALLAFYARTARAHGIQDGQTGTVTVIQRFGSGLQLNVHFHTLVLDGVFSEARPGQLTFHPAPHRATRTWRTSSPPSAVVSGSSSPAATWSPRPTRSRRTRSAKSRPSWPASLGPRFRAVSPSAPAPAPVSVASATSRTGHVTSRGPRQAQLDGFDLHANVWVPPTIAPAWSSSAGISSAPPLAQERVRLRADGRVLVALKTVWRAGTSHVLFEPIEFLEKLAAIIHRPAVNLLLYHGVLGPRARWRSQVVRYGRPRTAPPASSRPAPAPPSPRTPGPGRR